MFEAAPTRTRVLVEKRNPMSRPSVHPSGGPALIPGVSSPAQLYLDELLSPESIQFPPISTRFSEWLQQQQQQQQGQPKSTHQQ